MDISQLAHPQGCLELARQKWGLLGLCRASRCILLFLCSAPCVSEMTGHRSRCCTCHFMLQDTVAAAVGQAKEVATEAVSKAGSLLKGALGKLTGAFDSSKEAGSTEL